MGLGGGLLAGLRSAEHQDIVYRPCAARLDAASTERKRQALGQLALLRRALPPLSAVLREDAVRVQLYVFGSEFLPPEAVSRLPPLSRGWVEEGGDPAFMRDGDPWLRRYMWRRSVVALDAMVAGGGGSGPR